MKYRLLFIILFICLETELFSQEQIQSMRVHYKDGSAFDIPITTIDSITFEEVIVPPTITHYIESNEVLTRAYQMASMEWTPLRPVPKRGGGYYPPDTTVTGAPYSSVKEINTYLFQDVLYHTFMTAVHNPMSLLYTEDISRPPYHGTYCAPYYGTVCSSSVMWVLGIDIPYTDSQIVTLSDFCQLEHQVIDSLKICDIIWKYGQPGHVQMIYDIEYREDTLYKISTFETTGINTRINNYTKTQFLNLWNTNGYVGYRYNKLVYSSEPVVTLSWEPIAYNDNLCPSKGDKSVYRQTDTVIINIFDSNYSHIVLAQGSNMVGLDNNNGFVQQYYNLSPGIYSVFLHSDNESSARVSFEIIDTDVDYEWNDEEALIIKFHSSATPVYAILCDIHGVSRNYVISDLDRQRGYISISRDDFPNYTEYYCKVVFKGEYGRIINVPIRVE